MLVAGWLRAGCFDKLPDSEEMLHRASDVADEIVWLRPKL